MLQNARGAAFTVSELLKENQQWDRGKVIPPPRLGLKSTFLQRRGGYHYFMTVFLLF